VDSESIDLTTARRALLQRLESLERAGLTHLPKPQPLAAGSLLAESPGETRPTGSDSLAAALARPAAMRAGAPIETQGADPYQLNAAVEDWIESRMAALCPSR